MKSTENINTNGWKGSINIMSRYRDRSLEKELDHLNKIAIAYNKTEGDMKAMWKKKWYQLTKDIARRYESMLPQDHKDRLK